MYTESGNTGNIESIAVSGKFTNCQFVNCTVEGEFTNCAFNTSDNKNTNNEVIEKLVNGIDKIKEMVKESLEEPKVAEEEPEEEEAEEEETEESEESKEQNTTNVEPVKEFIYTRSFRPSSKFLMILVGMNEMVNLVLFYMKKHPNYANKTIEDWKKIKTKLINKDISVIEEVAINNPWIKATYTNGKLSVSADDAFAYMQFVQDIA